MDEPFVDELDMPPRAYFQIKLDLQEATSVATISAHVMQAGPFKTREQGELFSKLGVSRVHQELLTLGGGIIWWRTRPEIGQNADETWHFYARCGTSPTLPNSFWTEMGERDS